MGGNEYTYGKYYFLFSLFALEVQVFSGLNNSTLSRTLIACRAMQLNFFLSANNAFKSYYGNYHGSMAISSVESQKGAIAVQSLWW